MSAQPEFFPATGGRDPYPPLPTAGREPLYALVAREKAPTRELTGVTDEDLQFAEQARAAARSVTAGVTPNMWQAGHDARERWEANGGQRPGTAVLRDVLNGLRRMPADPADREAPVTPPGLIALTRPVDYSDPVDDDGALRDLLAEALTALAGKRFGVPEHCPECTPLKPCRMHAEMSRRSAEAVAMATAVRDAPDSWQAVLALIVRAGTAANAEISAAITGVTGGEN